MSITNNNKSIINIFINYPFIIIYIFLNFNLENCEINDNFATYTLEEENSDILDVTDNHNLNLIVTTSKKIYTGLPPLLRTTTNANLIKYSSIISVSESFLLASCLQDSLLTKIKFSDGSSQSLLDYSDININPFLIVPETICSLSIFDNMVFIGYTEINNYASETNKTNIIIRITLTNINAGSSGPNLDGNGSIKIFKFPQSTIKTNSIRQISCEPLKVSDSQTNYRLVCIHETKGYYCKNTNPCILEYFVYGTTINSNFNGFETSMNEFQETYGYAESGELGFRLYKINDTYARCLTKTTLTGVYLKMKSSKPSIQKDFISAYIYNITADLDLTSYSNSLRFNAEKVNFMNKNNIYSFKINKETSPNSFKLYDYKENTIKKLLGYYNKTNDYMICIYQTENKIKYFTLKNNQNIYNIGTKSTTINMKSYEHYEYNMNDLIDNLSSLGELNVAFITKNLSNSVSQEHYGIDFFNLFINNNIFIPEKSLKTWYRYNFSFIEHMEDDYTRMYYFGLVSIIVKTCNSFNCISCYSNSNQCDTSCPNSISYALTEDNKACYPNNLLIKGYIYDEDSNIFKKCYRTCNFCLSSSTDYSDHNCESCAKGYLYSYEYPGNCYEINNLGINEEKSVDIENEEFISDSCSTKRSLTNGECISNCPNLDIYYNFEYNDLTGGYIKTTIINSPKYLFNNKCYLECPSNTIYDQTNNVCRCLYAFHINNEETVCYSDSNCISDYPYKNLDNNQCHSSLSDCIYFFNNNCYNICPNGKVALNTKSEEIKEYIINELSLDNNLKDKLCICDTTNGVWKKILDTSNNLFLQECVDSLDSCQEGYEPESLTNQCVEKKTITTTIITTIIITQTMTTIITTQPMTTIITTQPMTTIITTQTMTTIITTQPMTTIITTQPMTTIITTQPKTTIITTQPMTTIITTQPMTTIITIQPMTTNITTQPLTIIITTLTISTILTTEPISTIITTEPITTQITTIITQPITTILTTNPINSLVTTVFTTQPIKTLITTISTEGITTLITTIITQISTTELTNIKTEIPTSILKETITTEILTLPIITFPSTIIQIFNPITEPFIEEEEEIKELILPEEYKTDPDNCLVVYNSKCYYQCPEGTCISQNDPTLMNCVKIKENSRIYNGICIMDLDKVINDIKSFSENNEVISTETGIIIRGYTSKSENVDIKSETKYSYIDLGECEKKIKEYYHLPDNTELFILGIDSPNKNKNSSASVYNYEIYLENGTRLDYLTACKDVKISMSTAINNPDLVNLNQANYFYELGYDIYESNSSFYKDNCAPASIDGNDLTLSDRKKDFYPEDISLCNESCHYLSVNFTTQRFTCECDNSYDFSNNYTNKVNNEEDDKNYINYLLSLINYKIFSCYRLLSDFSNYYNNAGFYIAIATMLFCLFQIFIFLKYGMISMNKIILDSTPNKNKLKEVLKLQEEKRREMVKLELLKNQNPPRKSRNNKNKTRIEAESEGTLKKMKEDTSEKIESFKDITKNKISHLKLKGYIYNQNNNINIINIENNNIRNTNIVAGPNLNNDDINIYNLEREKMKQKSVYILTKKKKKKKKSIKIKTKYKISLKNNNINNILSNDDLKNIPYINKNDQKDVYDFVNYMVDKHINKKELNTVPFTQALRIDKRSFWEIFLSVLAHEIDIVDIFYYKNSLTHISINLSIYVFELCLDLTLNCLLYTDDVVSEKYNNNGSITFFTSLSLSFMSNILASIIAYVIGKLAEYGEIMELLLKDVVIKKQYFLNMIKFKKYLKLKISAFFIIQGLINFGMFYYLMIFWTIYHKTQGSVMVNYIIGIAESIAIALGLAFITSLLRYLSIKNEWRSIYYTSKYFFEKF